MIPSIKSALKSALGAVGLEIRRVNGGCPQVPGSTERPIGETGKFLEDLRARGFAPRGILDVGANRGDWTRLALSIFPKAAIIMIEPQDEMQPCLSQLSKSRADCHYVKAGAGREPGELIQTIWDDLAGSSFLPQADNSQIQAGKQRKTPITTLDKLLSEAYPGFFPDLVKLDIQGFELEALAGAQRTFGQTEVFIIETSLFRFMPRQPITSEVVSFMSERGYEFYDITEYLRRPCDGALGQVDFAFVKAGGRFHANAQW